MLHNRHLLTPLLIVLAGCGTIYAVKPITVDESVTGLQYVLPKNLVELDVTVNARTYKPGELHSYASACGIEVQKTTSGSRLSYRSPIFRLTIHPTDADRYVVDLSQPWWPLTSKSVQMRFDSRGSPQSFSSSSEDITFNLVHEALLIAGARPRSTPTARTISRSGTTAPPTNQCESEAKSARDAIHAIERQLESTVFDVASDPRGIDVAAYDRVVKDLQGRRQRLLNLFVGTTSVAKQTMTVIVDPCRCTTSSCNWRLLHGDEAKPPYTLLKPVGANRFKIDQFEDCGSGDGLCLQIRPQSPPGTEKPVRKYIEESCDTANDEAPKSTKGDRSRRARLTGFHYRIPGAAELNLNHLSDGNTISLSTAHLPIAQYGPTDALPSRFGLLLSKIDQLELDPLTGSIISISVNGKGLAKDDIKRALNYDAEREQRYIDSLDRQKKTLELEKALRTLQDEINEDGN